MEKYIYDEKTGISYTLQGDYYLPDIALSTEEQQPVGLWGQRHARYLKQHHTKRNKKNCSPQLSTTSGQLEKPNRKRLI